MGSISRPAKLGMPLEHSPQVSELFKMGSLNYSDLREMQLVVEEALFRMTLHRDHLQDWRNPFQEELYVELYVNHYQQLARVRIFFLAFVNGIVKLSCLLILDNFVLKVYS